MENIIQKDEKPAFAVYNEDSNAPFIITAEHASNCIPKSLSNLGLSDEVLETHVAYDLFIKDFTLELSAQLACPLITSEYSRLVIDCNRVRESFELFRLKSDNIEIEGNSTLSGEEKEARLVEIYDAFHNTVIKVKDNYMKNNVNFSILSIHSFTPQLAEDGKERPWDIGLMWDVDSSLADKMYAFFKENYLDLICGLNVPYDARKEEAGSMHVHAYPCGIPAVEIELNQKSLADKQKRDGILSAFVAFCKNI